MSDTMTFWVRWAEDAKSWVCGVGTQALFMGFSSDDAAWTWLRAHLADKYEAVLRSEERREMIEKQLAISREVQLAALLEPKRVQ
jgi:hypothetical protein